MNAITNFYDAAAGRITDPVMFMAADASLKKQVISLWAADNARHAATFADKADSFFSDAQSSMSSGPWQSRSEMCEASTAGVASVISAVDTLPTFLPDRCARSSSVR